MKFQWPIRRRVSITREASLTEAESHTLVLPPPERPFDDDWITVYPVGQNRRRVAYNRKTNTVNAGCFMGSVEAFKAQIVRDYDSRVVLEGEGPEFTVNILAYKAEYLATAAYFVSLRPI